jgi:chromosomal replication initiation ATPase DnaA
MTCGDCRQGARRRGSLFNHSRAASNGVHLVRVLKAMSGVEPRLISRLKGGLLVALPPPGASSATP